ncbi:uncharacterized protein LOC127278677 [Leptopilina boulardi]|uniref:uncharacterized protein LOC127278677 n=1 Tax=Leptopilina boulardi TaxID=63433 RepID=UPI0021F5E327|nr:uncharacterized protein LOC127278677 [Leptopilina boulardi]
MHISNFLNSLQIIYIVTLYTCINGDGSILQSQHMPSKINETLNGTESIEEQLTRKKEIAHLTNLGMDEPELFYNLTHPNNFPKNCTNLKQKMRHLYKSTNYYSHSRALWFNFVLKWAMKFYREGNFSSSIRFEDYFAIRYYTIKGYGEMIFDTDVSRRIKNALFSLAITQSSDPNEQMDFTLFRGNTELTSWYKEQFNETKNELQWHTFIETTSTRKEAEFMTEDGKFSDAFLMTEGVYEMHFSKPYLRANINNYTSFGGNNETVLIPGMKFFINETIWNKENGTNERLTIKMTHNDENIDLFDQQKKVMSELKKLRESGTQFYVC